MTINTFHTAHVNNQKIFYSEAGKKNVPVLRLLHGLPSSSQIFRDLTPVLADDSRLFAPDMPGVGFSEAPDRIAV